MKNNDIFQFYSQNTLEQPNNEIWYWAPEKVTLYNSTGVTEHTFSDGKGVLKFASAVTNAQSWFRTTAVTDVRLPDTVTIIEAYAFDNCTSLALTSLPSRLTSIGQSAFQNCTNLALTSLPSGLTSIESRAFYNCTSLALTELPSGVTIVGGSAFELCRNITLTKLPSGLTTIRSSGFQSCPNIALTELPSGLTEISSGAFAYDYGLVTITFNGTPLFISYIAFAVCNNLRNIYVPWSEDEVANAPWGASSATIHYNS